MKVFSQLNIHTQKAKLLLIFLFTILLSVFVYGQKQNSLALAEKYYAAGYYYTAAGLYEQYLNPVKKTVERANFPLNAKRYRTGATGIQLNKNDVLFKQAHSYRLANYWKEAAEKYKQSYEKDEAKYADAVYWYAVCQRSLGNYTGAEESIKKYLAGNGQNNFTAAAKNELETLQYINAQLKRPDTVMYKIVKSNTSFGGEKGVYAPAFVSGNKFLFTSTETDTAAKKGENPYHNRLYETTVADNSIQVNQLVNVPGIDAGVDNGAASVSADGNHLYYTQWKKENGKNFSQVYHAVKKENGWGKPLLLPAVNVNNSSSKQPYCSADGKYLFFSSNRPGGKGGFDIWYASLNADGTTGSPVNISNINTEADEQAPFFHTQSATLVFSSNGFTGMGGFDLFTSVLKDEQWTKPENMGHPVNSSRDDIYFFAAENGTLLKNAMFSSDRGSGCCLETYSLVKSPKKKIINGIVKDLKNNEPVADAFVSMKDEKGNITETTTGPDGKFTFELSGDPLQNVFKVTKDKYKDKTEEVKIENVDEADWSTDVVNNVPILIEKKIVISPETVVTIYFDFDKYDIKPRSAEVLDSLYNVLVQDTTAAIQVSGYTDGLGTVEYNNVLSDKRAKACADYLIQKGIDTRRITFESFGECCPVEMELINGRDNPDGRSRNRRALINVTKGE